MKRACFRGLALLLSFAFAFCGIPFVVSAEVNGFVYTIADGEVTITDYKGSETNLVIPSEIEGLPVTEIEAFAFDECAMTSVVIPGSVRRIGGGAFYYCINAKSITIPSSVTSIGYGAFYYCTGLTSLTIPSSVKTLGSQVFAYCKGLKSFTIPNSVTVIPDGAFSACYALESITIPNSVTSIEYSAFSECVALKSVTIPDSVKSIGGYVFERCFALTSANIPNGIKTIESGMFNGCQKLTKVTIPGSVTAIGNGAFLGCYGLTSIDGMLAGVTSIGDSAFTCCHGLTSVKIPASVKSIGEFVFQACENLTSVDVSASVTSIGDSAFFQCDKLKTLTIRNPFCVINEEASTVTYTIPKNTTIVGYPKSTARNYATKNGNAFAALSCAHQYGTEFVTTKKATLTADGVMQKQCKICTYVYPQTTAIRKPVSFTFLRSTYSYNGGLKTPTVVIKDSSGKTLVNGTDYTYTYETDRKSVGAHTIKVKFKGNYSGTKTMTYYVVPKATSKIEVTQDTNTLNISWKAVKGADGYRVFVYKNGKQIYAKRTTKLTRTVKDLAPGMKYTVRVRAYMNIGDERFYAINSTSVNTATKPTKPILTVKAGKECATLTWSKKNCTNYQIRYSTNENFKDYEYLKVKGSENVSATIKNLESGKKYYFKVRAYKYVGGVRYYGGFSKVKSVTVK